MEIKIGTVARHHAQRKLVFVESHDLRC